MFALQALATDIRRLGILLSGLHFFQGELVDIEFFGLHGGEPSVIFDGLKFTSNLRSVFWRPVD